MTCRFAQLLLIILLVAAAPACAQTIFNPSFELELEGWHTYTYLPPQAGPGVPVAGCIGVGCPFDILIETTPPDGTYVCGTQAWGTTRNGGVAQDFYWSGDAATVSVRARAFSVKYDFSAYDNGCRVRMGIYAGTSYDRTLVTSWTTFPWGASWSERTITIPGPGYYTLFIEALQPNNLAIMSTLWDHVVITPLPPVQLTAGPVVTASDPQHPDTTVTITWSTNVPSTSRVEYGTTPALGSVAEDTELVTDHSVTLTDLENSAEYSYKLISSAPDYVTLASDVYGFVTPIRFSNVRAATTSDGSGVLVTWNTDIPAATQLEYGPSASYGSLTTEDPALVTAHSVTLTDLPEDSEFHFRAIARNSQANYTDAFSDDFTFRTLPEISETLRNPGFEDTHGMQGHSLYPWVQYASEVSSLGYHPIDGLVGPFPQGGPDFWFVGVQAFEGSYFVGTSANSTYKNGGVFQRVESPPGQFCTLAAQFMTYEVGGHPNIVRLGIDPSGGVDSYSPSVQWWSGSSSTNDSQWHPAAVTTKAGPNGFVTLFVDFRQQYPQTWQVSAVDAVQFGPPASAEIGDLKSSQAGLQGVLAAKKVSLVMPDYFRYQGIYYRKLYVQEDDRSAGIAVLLDEADGPIPEPGNRVTMIGSLSVRDMEAVFTAQDWTVDGSTTELPPPVALRQSALGGSAVNQPALLGSSGLCNVGLRVRVFGKVTYADAEGYPGLDNNVHIDDGSGLADESGSAGIRVFLAPNYEKGVFVGDYIAATGVLTVQYVDPDGWPNGNEYHTYRVVTATDADWTVVKPIYPE